MAAEPGAHRLELYQNSTTDHRDREGRPPIPGRPLGLIPRGQSVASTIASLNPHTLIFNLPEVEGRFASETYSYV